MFLVTECAGLPAPQPQPNADPNIFLAPPLQMFGPVRSLVWMCSCKWALLAFLSCSFPIQSIESFARKYQWDPPRVDNPHGKHSQASLLAMHKDIVAYEVMPASHTSWISSLVYPPPPRLILCRILCVISNDDSVACRLQHFQENLIKEQTRYMPGTPSSHFTMLHA